MRHTVKILAVFILLGYAEGAISSGPSASGEHTTVTFERLSKYSIPVQRQVMNDALRRRQHKPPRLEFEIPADVTALSGRKIEIAGYMLPMEDPEKNRVHKFVLVRNPVTCCFGCSNQLNEFMVATMPGKLKTRLYLDQPVMVRGIFRPGALYEDGYLVTIYQLEAETVIPQ